jgi:hypothetical protein
MNRRTVIPDQCDRGHHVGKRRGRIPFGTPAGVSITDENKQVGEVSWCLQLGIKRWNFIIIYEFYPSCTAVSSLELINK